MNALGLALIAPLRRGCVTLVVLALVVTCSAALASVASAEPDYDGDGHADDDCAPFDPAVHPSVVDRPDLTFEDMDCDGIDGDESNAIFVALDGDDTAAGTRTNPMRTVAAAVAAAEPAGADVYIAGGSYETEPAGGVPMADDVGLYGGYEPQTGARSVDQVTTIKGSPQALLAEGDTGVVLQLLTLEGTPDASLSAYGVRAVADGSGPSRLALSKVSAIGAAAIRGTPGSAGARGIDGGGLPGGAGGAGGCGSGVAGQPGDPGGGSGPGSNGDTGAHATPPGAPDAAVWPLGSGSPGGDGAPGGGGTGGARGTGALRACGGRGGTGGAGGGGGDGGTGGQSGGGSFGVYAFNSSVVVSDSTFAAGNGGAGGNGGSSGSPGVWTRGSIGAPGVCVPFGGCSDPGWTGLSGYFGGFGGVGGAGAGGPSFGVYQAGPESGFAADDETVMTNGSAGMGGSTFGPNTPPTSAASGEAAELRRSATAPVESAADFDGDGVDDPADPCPDLPGSGDGCPVRPPKVSPPTPGSSNPGTVGGAGSGGGSPSTSAGAPARDATPPSWTISAAKAQRALKAKAITFSVRPNEGCTLTVVAKLAKRTLASVTRALPGGTTSKITLKLRKKALGALRKALSRRSKIAVALVANGVDANDNTASSTTRLRLKR